MPAKRMKHFIFQIKKQPPGRLIVIGFALVILFGTGLLLLPVSVKDGARVSFIDALFTSTSAVCVTGLIAIDVADHFTTFGQTVVAALIQIGGLGVTSIGAGLIIAARKKIGIKGRVLVKEAFNVDGFKGMVRLVKAVLLMTLCFELVGIGLSFIVFVQDYPPLKALGISAFHSIAAFNNSGFDILGGLRNLIPYQSNVLLNLTTCGLIIFGGLGFLVILDILKKTLFPKAKFAFQGSYYHNGCLARNWHPASKSNGKYFVARSVFPKCICPDGRIFNLCDWRIFKRWVVYIDYPDVYRSFSGVYGRWYQNQYLLCFNAAGKKPVYQKAYWRFSPKHPFGSSLKSLHDFASLRTAGMRRHLSALHHRAGVQLCASAF